MEQTDTLLNEGNAQLLSGLEDGSVVLAAGGGGNVLDTRAGGAEDVVDEGELGRMISAYSSSRRYISQGMITYESIGGDGHLAELLEPSITLLLGEGSGDLLEDALVLDLLGLVARGLAGAEQVNGVALVGALGALLPLDVDDTVVEAHPPVVGLVAGQTSAVDTALLAGTEADDLAVEGVADRVGLSVLQGDGGDGQVTESSLGQGGGLGSDDVVEGLAGRDDNVVAVLGELNAVQGAALLGSGVVVLIHLKNKVLATLLLGQDLQGLGLVAGGNNTVGHLARDDLSGGGVDDVAQGENVTEAGHAVSTTGTGISLSQTRGLKALDIVNHVDLALLLGERNTDSRTGGRDVLEAGRSRETKSLLELLDQRPCVEGVKQIDVAGSTVQDLEGQLALGHESGSGLLVRVGTVAERELRHAIASILLAEEARDSSVIVGGLLEGLQGVLLAASLGDLTGLELLEEFRVVSGVRQDSDTLVVLGCGAEQSHTTDINLLNGLVDGDVDLGDGLLEGVQVADDEVDLGDLLLGEVLLVGLDVSGKDTAVHSGVEGLDTATKHLGGVGDGGDVPRKVLLAWVSLRSSIHFA